MRLSVAVSGPADPAVLAQLESGTRRLIGGNAPIELLVVEAGGRMSRARNQALHTARAELLVFLDPRDSLESSFLEHACRLLDEDAALTFVTSLGDDIPLRDEPAPRPCDPLALVARSWFVHAPTVLRRAPALAAGGFDESLAACEDTDLLLRLLHDGGRGAIVPEAQLRTRPFGGGLQWDSDGAPEAARVLFQRHHALFEDRWEELLLAQERIARQLFAVRAVPSDRATLLDRERTRLHRALAEVETRLARLSRG